MNLFTISGISVRYDGTPESNPIQLTTSEFELAFTGDVFNYSVLGLTEPDALLPEITLNNESSLTVARLNGVDLTGDAGEPLFSRSGAMTARHCQRLWRGLLRWTTPSRAVVQ